MKVKMQNKWSHTFYILAVILLFLSCHDQPRGKLKGDMILFNAFIYPVKGNPIENGAVVISKGKITATGNSEEILKEWRESVKESIDCHGEFLMSGFIEGHGHFSSMGFNLINVDLMQTHSWNEIIDSVANRVKKVKPGEWITGRGWHQEKWNVPVDRNVNGYPYNDVLSRISPNNPVILEHASGHSLIANEVAMKIAGISKETPDPAGGRIVRDKSGIALGVFEERAMDLIKNPYQEILNKLPEKEKRVLWLKAISKSQLECLQYGITTFEDAGSTQNEINWYNELAKHDSLDVRLWVMVRHEYDTLKLLIAHLPIIRSGSDMFTCNAIKTYIDGALGSYGAWLLEPYADKAGFTGQNTTPLSEIKNTVELAIEHDMQMCIHAIGDRGNREVLNIYEEVMNEHPEKKDLRWRIEHAQHIDPSDMPRFKQLSVIASMQGIHCTSDAPFVVKRLGEERARTGAYAWRSLLDEGVVIANGTDAPVEHVDPIPNIYASVTRKRLDNGMVFFPQQAMTRKEAIYSYTFANAYAAKEDDIKGSLEPGKWADIVLLSKNLLTCPDDSIPKINVLLTMVGGKIKYQRN
ncbi:MAG: amidohydrolase family protein [Saprospiraceae bacterium]